MRGKYIRYSFYIGLLLIILGTYSYMTYVGQTNAVQVQQLNGAQTQSKVNAFNAALQDQYARTQLSGVPGTVSLVLSDADADYLVTRHEQGNFLDTWWVHFRSDGLVEVWGENKGLYGSAHHHYYMDMKYSVASYQNTAAATVGGINFSGVVLPGFFVDWLASNVVQPAFQFPAGVDVALSVSEGQMTVAVTTRATING